MCLLVFYSEDTYPDTHKLCTASECNPDGFGFAIASRSAGMVVGWSLDSDQLIDSFTESRKAHPDGPALFHARLSTGGTVSLGNCHPFYVGDDRETVVGHNGILPASVQPGKQDKRCDTRIFANTVLPTRNWGTAKGRRRLGRWIGTDKLVILTTNRTKIPKKNGDTVRAEIINEHYGHWDDGVWYSNRSYSPYSTKYWGGIMRQWDWEDSTPGSLAGQGTLHYAAAIGYHLHYILGAPCRPDCTRSELEPDKDSGLTTEGEVLPAALRQYGSECMTCGCFGTVSTVTLICSTCFTCQECGGYSEDDPTAMNPCLCYVPPQYRNTESWETTIGTEEGVMEVTE